MSDIKKLLQGAKTPAEAIKILTSSRHTQQPDMRAVTSQIDPYQHPVMDRTARPDRKTVVNLTDETGQQLYDQEGNERTKIEYVKVARVATSLQQTIVDRAVAFLFGNDVQYTTDSDDSAQNKVLEAIKKALTDANERSHNRRLAREVFTSTEAAELWYLVETDQTHSRYGFPARYKLRSALFEPSKGDVLYPYFSPTGDLEAFSRKFEIYGTEGQRHYYFEAFTATTHYMWEKGNTSDWQPVPGYPEKVTLGKIPVVYICQPHTEWHLVQPLIDRLETLLSNFADTNDYHAAPKIFVTGDIRGWGKKGESGQIIEGEVGANAQYLSWSQAPESVKTEVEMLLRLIYTETQTPDISFETLKSMSAPSGVALKLLFMDAHLKVQQKMEYFSEALRRRVSVVKELLASIAPAQFKKAAADMVIDGEVRPYIVADDSAEMGVISAATGGKAVMSRRTAIQRLGYVDNIDEELERIDEDEAGNANDDLVDAFAETGEVPGKKPKQGEEPEQEPKPEQKPGQQQNEQPDSAQKQNAKK